MMKRLPTIHIAVLVFTFSSMSYSGQFPERVISLSPSTTEIIYGLGAWERVVGVTLYTDFPPEAEKLPKVGGWINPNLEAVLALRPDLVVMMLPQDEMFGGKIRKLGLQTLSVDSNPSIEAVMDSITQIGRALGKREESEKLRESVKAGIAEIKEKTRRVPRKKVLLVVGRNPGTLEDIYAIGRTSYINEIITVAGGENVVDTDKLAIKISQETVLSLNPEVIVEINHDTGRSKSEILRIWSDLKEAPAVKNDEVHIVSSKALLHPSQRVVEGVRILAEILHPEVFEEKKRSQESGVISQEKRFLSLTF